VTPIPLDLVLVSKDDVPDPATPGQTLVYTLTVRNAGQVAANGVSVTDALPGGVTFLSAAGTNGFVCGAAGQQVGCTGGTIAGGATAIINIQVLVDNPCIFTSPFVNQASVALAAGGEINTTNNTATASTVITGCVQATGTVTQTRTSTPTATVTSTGLATNTITQTPVPPVDLVIQKFDAPDPVTTSGILTYTLLVQNQGTAAVANVTVQDVLPAGVTFLNATGDNNFVCNFAGTTPTGAADTVTCTTSSVIGAGGGATITIVVGAPCTGPAFLTNTATIDPSNVIPESNENNNTASSVTSCGGIGTATPTDTPTTGPTLTATPTNTLTPIPTTQLSFDKTGAPGLVTTNQNLTYTLTIANTSGTTVSNLDVTDLLPTEVQFVSAVGSHGFVCTGNVATNLVACINGSIPDGETATITIDVVVTSCATATILNTAFITNPAVSDNAATRTTNVVCPTATPVPTNTATPSPTP
jgi:uncharacterized repeat protein (TIGR01451 family)